MDCKHRWIIDKAELGVLPAKCKKCGDQRVFPVAVDATVQSLKSAKVQAYKVRNASPNPTARP